MEFQVPASDFEVVFKLTQPELCAQQPGVFFHLVTLLSPTILKRHSIPVHSILQHMSSVRKIILRLKVHNCCMQVWHSGGVCERV
jgi:hypothetical protein